MIEIMKFENRNVLWVVVGCFNLKNIVWRNLIVENIFYDVLVDEDFDIVVVIIKFLGKRRVLEIRFLISFFG